jgi:hypothetical protein
MGLADGVDIVRAAISDLLMPKSRQKSCIDAAFECGSYSDMQSRPRLDGVNPVIVHVDVHLLQNGSGSPGQRSAYRGETWSILLEWVLIHESDVVMLGVRATIPASGSLVVGATRVRSHTRCHLQFAFRLIEDLIVAHF